MYKRLIQLFNAATELPRYAGDMAGFRFQWGRARDALPAGDGHPVLIIPGFLTTDHFTAGLRDVIAEKGYKTYAWEGGLNTGFNDRAAQHLRDQLFKIYKENGNRKVSLVGHSLGGIFARELAREFPDKVRVVVTLGSPAGMVGKPGSASPMLGRLYEFFNPASDHENLDLQVRGQTPPPVPVTSVYSESDGVVWWQACLNPLAKKAENVAVRCGHLGMVLHLPAIAVVLDRLAQKEDGWKKFDAGAYGAKNYAPLPDNDALPHNPAWTQAKSKSRPLFGRARK